jgi:hypothetical protein
MVSLVPNWDACSETLLPCDRGMVFSTGSSLLVHGAAAKRPGFSVFQIDFAAPVRHDEQRWLGGISMLEVTCPHCGACVPFVPELVGREIFCLGCGSHYVIPDLRPQTTTGGKDVTAKPVVVDPSPTSPPAPEREGHQDTG